MFRFALIAQAVSPDSAPLPEIPAAVMILAISAGVGVIFLTLIVSAFKYTLKEREMQHAERLKAIERGFHLDEFEEERRFRKGIMRLALVIGGAVPAVSVIAAALAVANMSTSVVTSMTVFLIWTGAAAVGVAGVASGAWLAQVAIARLSPGSRRSTPPASVYAGSYEPQQAAVGR